MLTPGSHRRRAAAAAPRGGAAMACLALAVACSPASGTLELRVVDADGSATPARVEILDERGRSHVAADALEIRTECAMPPLPDWASAVEGALHRSRSIDNPYTGTTQFYVDGATSTPLPAGRYHVTVSRGSEHRVAVREVEVAAGETTHAEIALERWIDMPHQGWYSSDDHLHITRLTPQDDATIGVWMRAEDIHVANLLRMGTVEHFDITPQYAFGDDGVYRDGDTMLVSGQEHPRTHVLGHTIILGAEEPIDLRDSYLVYQRFWREAERLGGASGYAHFGAGRALNGLAVDAPSGLLSFVEVLQFDLPYYDVWYELLNLGVRIAPTAGTDFPCIPSVPGRDHFYARIEGPPTRAAFVDAVRRGRTFVTNGPVLEIEIGGKGMGEEVRLPGVGVLRVRGRVRFDPERDDVQELALIHDGETTAVASERSGPGEIVLESSELVLKSGWFAVRATGEKRGETPMRTPFYMTRRALDIGCMFGCGASMHPRADFVGEGRPRPAAAHSAPLYVRIGDTAPASRPEMARRWLERLDALERDLEDDRIDDLVVLRPFAAGLLLDGVPDEVLRRDRAALREEIAKARAVYEDYSK